MMYEDLHRNRVFPTIITEGVEHIAPSAEFREFITEAMRQHRQILEMHAALFNIACCFKITAEEKEKGAP